MYSLLCLVPVCLMGQNLSCAQWAEQDLFRGAQLSLHFRDLQSGQTLDSYQADQYLIPASNLKIITTAAAMDILGPHFRFATTVGLDGVQREGKWQGNLWIKGGGDPCWNSNYFPEHTITRLAEYIFSALRQNGISSLQGDILLDVQGFDQHWHNRDWSWADIGNYYGISSSAFNCNDNALNVRFNTEGAIGEKAKIQSVEPHLPINWDNQVIIGAPGSGDQAYVFGNAQDVHRIIRGSVPKKGPHFDIRASMSDPQQFFARQLVGALKKLGLKFDGPPQILVGASMGRELVSVYSPELHEIINYINRESNNLFAEAIYKYLYTLESKRFTEWKEEQLGENPYRWKDGCGLSPFNRFSARMMTDVLVSQSNQEKFMMSLAAPGQEGTLRYRLGGLTIRAKTGSIEGVSTLSGYLWGEEGNAYAFSLMLNNYHGSSRALYQEIQNLLKSWSDR